MEMSRLLPILGIAGGILAFAGLIVPLFLPQASWVTTACESLALLCFIILFFFYFQKLRVFHSNVLLAWD